MKEFFRTRFRRFLFICAIVFMTVGIIYEYQKSRIIHPSEWYFFSVNSEAVDIRSPTNKVIIEMELKKGDYHYALYLKHCSSEEKINNSSLRFGSRYRNIRLCNSIESLNLSDFKIRHDFIKEKVDEIWKDYYTNHVVKVFSGSLKGILALCLTAFILFLFSWVRNGEKSSK